MDDLPDEARFGNARAEVPLTDRANREPAILRGLTSSEAQLAILVVMPVYTVIGLLVALITRIWALGVLIGSLAPMLTVWALAGWLARVKRNKPDFYYQHRFNFWLAKKGLRKSRFIDHHGYWDIGRDMPAARPASGLRTGRAKPTERTRAGG